MQRGKIDRAHGHLAASTEDLRHGQLRQIKPWRDGAEADRLLAGSLEGLSHGRTDTRTEAQGVILPEAELAPRDRAAVVNLPGQAGRLGRDLEKLRRVLRRDVGRQRAAEFQFESRTRVDVVPRLNALEGEGLHGPERELVGLGQFGLPVLGRQPGGNDKLPPSCRRQRDGRSDEQSAGQQGIRSFGPGGRIAQESPTQTPILPLGRHAEVIVGLDQPHVGRNFPARGVDEVKKPCFGRDRKIEGQLDLDCGRDLLVIPHPARNPRNPERRGEEACGEFSGQRFSVRGLEPAAHLRLPRGAKRHRSRRGKHAAARAQPRETAVERRGKNHRRLRRRPEVLPVDHRRSETKLKRRARLDFTLGRKHLHGGGGSGLQHAGGAACGRGQEGQTEHFHHFRILEPAGGVASRLGRRFSSGGFLLERVVPAA